MRTGILLRGIGFAMLPLALAACGGRQPLKPIEGQKMPAVPVGAAAAPAAQELMTPSIQARPERTVDLLTNSRVREDDPFDLPPESQP
ncbi:Argininosuccinate lyase [Sphingomonas paucimobilis]|nr:Argininosuccinate lyase [Sphingomonas paucimobilis]